ncbi:MAG TPA: HIT domain-containing protein [Candidatus Krumholzibacteria bacterium]|nr:HIT domain-containing protein [Candidatus Krumholzibacteria bacterium]
MMDRLYAPWRAAYFMTEKDDGCLFCKLVSSTDDRAHMILARGRDWFVVVNRYPYTTGHVMVVCNRHVEKMGDFRGREGEEMVELVGRCERAIARVYAPDGVNLGANLGRSAGAGVVGHFHLHVVPRWQGDTNFMSAVGETRVVSEDLNDTYDKLHRALQES